MREMLDLVRLVILVSVVYFGLAYIGLWVLDNVVFACIVG